MQPCGEACLVKVPDDEKERRRKAGKSPTSGLPPPKENQFPPGVSGNPGGRPKGSPSILAALRRRLAANANDDGEGDRAGKLADMVLATLENAMMRAQKGEEVKLDLRAVFNLMEAIDPPKHRVLHEHRKRVVLRGVMADGTKLLNALDKKPSSGAA